MIKKQMQEMKVWSQNVSNKQVLESISFNSESNFYEALNRLFTNDSEANVKNENLLAE